jgi:hypothetical protein
MTNSLKFERLPARPPTWDQEIRKYTGKTVFHESCWHDHVLDIHPRGRIDYFRIHRGTEAVGVHCGLRITKLGIPIHGSPLGGTGTNFLGPLIDDTIVSAKDVALGLRSLSGLVNGVHLEFAHWKLDRSEMLKAGFVEHVDVTNLLMLPSEVESAWAGLKSTCRNRIRRAQQNGLIVERVTDASIADAFFEQFIEVYAKQGMVTPFGIERPRSLFRNLHPAGRLLSLRVLNGGEVLATGLFPFDEHCIYFWGAASWLSAQSQNPNELLHWEVIKYAVENGIGAYNLCGGQSQFKDKFGGSDVPYIHFSRSTLPGLVFAREFYRKLHYARLRKR